ncbi:sensor domain-containing diguanylate cyclase [Pigmentibacter sp. JX0631]|uniref:sensor domain-containing diguanylate cyclase n=1 Tax=Pigmentibacter sp. JX0631 TaxID=2976982 RepID=UPI002468FDE7|nr:sensor domain-containing diguanylate cyclase [Pigmentibacter sp. JX0631]WGL60653.1 sensor domain-containing diguanylate cyclase [Pigmentibacter sp. JX0631]
MENQSVLDSRLIEKFEAHRDFTRVFLDAFVLINKEQKVLKFNAAFCQIIELRSIDIRRIDNLKEMLSTTIPGSEKSAIEQILESNAPTRIDEVPAVNLSKRKNLTLIISSYPYYENDGKMLGACLLLRDVTAETNLQSKYKDKTIQSITDPLTGLYTRRYFEEQIDKEIERCKNNNIIPKLSVIMFDLDKFKSVNDTYGHQAGDFVLAETARILKTQSRRSDVLGRYGGEELLVLIFDTSERGAAVAAEKFRQAIQNNEYVFNGTRIPVTTSVGVTLIKGVDDTKESAVKRADECLYQAKESGRNVVIVDFGQGRIPVQTFLGTNPEV